MIKERFATQTCDMDANETNIRLLPSEALVHQLKVEEDKSNASPHLPLFLYCRLKSKLVLGPDERELHTTHEKLH